MGTRGTIKLIFKQKTVRTYNHWDSYPEELGKNLVEQIGNLLSIMTLDELIQKLDSLKIITDDMNPTLEDIAKLAPYTSLNVSTQSTYDWYCLLRGCQGSITKMIECGYILNQDMYEGYNYVLDFNNKQFYIEEYNNKFDICNIPYDWIDQLAKD